MSDKKPDDKDKWSTGAKVGAAVGSAALLAALMYAGRRSLTRNNSKLEPMSPEPKATAADVNQPKTNTD